MTQSSPKQFLALVLVLSLPFWLLGILAPNSFLPFGLPVSALMTACPMLAALALTARQGGGQAARRLFARALDIRLVRDRRWVWPSVVIMPAVMLSMWFLMQLLGYPLPTPHVALVSIPLMLLVYFAGAVGEELGWMGYLVDPLQERMNAISAALIIGVAWQAWHIVPFYAMGRSVQWIVAQFVAGIFMRIIIVWLYNKTNESVCIAIVFHTLINVTFSVFPDQGSYYDPVLTAFVLAILVVGLGVHSLTIRNGATNL